MSYSADSRLKVRDSSGTLQRNSAELCYMLIHLGAGRPVIMYVCVFVEHVGACPTCQLPYQSTDPPPSSPQTTTGATTSTVVL